MTKVLKPDLIKSFPVAKVDEAKQEVWGNFTAEVLDSDNEIADYNFQSKQIKAWSDEMFQKTSNAGQEASLGNVRMQHTDQPVGKVIAIQEDPASKVIGGGTYIDNADAWRMAQKGILTGFSFGGHYLWRKCEECSSDMPLACGENYCIPCHKNVVVRYGAKIAELSICDRPAVPVANILHIKADGSQKLEKPMEKEAKTKRVAGEDLHASAFAYVGDPDKTETWKLPIKFSDEEKTKRHIRNALARFGQTKGIPADEKAKVKAKIVAAAKEHGIETSEEESKSDAPTLMQSFVKAEMQRIADSITAKGTAAGITFRKGLFEVASFAEALQRMAWLHWAAINEREMEDDESEVPELLLDNLESLSDTFLAMAQEEIEELKESAKKAGKVTTMEVKKEQAVSPAIGETLTGHIAETGAHHEHMAEVHKSAAASHDKLEAMHKSMHEHYSKAAEDGGEHEEHHTKQAAMHKAMADHHAEMADHHEDMSKAHGDHAAKCMKAAEACDAEKSVKAIKDARDAQPVVKKAAAPAAENVVSFTANPNASDAEKAAYAKAEQEWLNSEEYKTLTTEAFRKSTINKLNLEVSQRAQVVAGAKETPVLHAVERGGASVKTDKAEAEAEAVLGY